MSETANLNKLITEATFVIVGAGFYGLTLAELISRKLKENVLIIEKRNFIGGNASSFFDPSSGIEVHKYGSHLFHTSNQRIWEYVNQFSSFNSYRHFVISKSGTEEYEMPMNLSTINTIYNKSLTPLEAKIFMDAQTSPYRKMEQKNLEDFALSQIGPELYSKLVQGYTTKQWGRDPKELPREIFQRLPLRYNYNRDYFSDSFMGLPSGGYSALFENMIKDSRISISLSTDYFSVKDLIPSGKKVIYSGPVDQYFDYEYGDLDWRTLDFEFESLELEDFQGCAVVNYPDVDIPFTRIHEFKHLHPERENSNKTIIAREYSRAATREDEKYYPINTESNRNKLNLYQDAALSCKNLMIGGRLGSYKYLDMHMAIGLAMRDFDKIVDEWE